MKYAGLKFWIVALLLSMVASCGEYRSLGRDPEGDELAQIDTLSDYKNGSFQNIIARPDSTIKHNRLRSLFHDRVGPVKPTAPVPWVKTDLKALPSPAPTIVWFGHSSLLIKTRQGNILIDPVFSNHAGPVPGLVKAFKGTTHYHAKDMPPIDVLLISHDHYDHLDYHTVKKLKDKIKLAVVPSGVGSQLIYWGFDPKKVIELNWNRSTTLPGGIRITATPAQHHSGRTSREGNKTLWASYVIQTGKYKIFYGGDGGYTPEFKKLGNQYGPFDLAFLECGQFNQPYVHLGLGEAAKAAVDLHAKMLQPVHWAKFPEANHPWNEPIKTLVPAAEKLNMPLNTPRIGEPYTLGDPPKITVWWNF